MNLEFTDEQRLIRDSAREFLSQACPPAAVRAARRDPRGCSAELWRAMADLGWMGLVVPECHGGSGASFMDLVVLLEEMGRVCLPGPFFSTTVVGARCLLAIAGDRQQAELLPRLAGGELVLAMALQEQGGEFDPSAIQMPAEATPEGYRLSGTKLFVADAQAADLLLCVARTGAPGTVERRRGAAGLSLFLVPRRHAQLRLAPLPSLGGEQWFEVIFDDVELAGAAMVGETGAVWPALRQVMYEASVAKCAEMVGGAQRVVDLVVPYVREREQFDRPIGSFQAVQHHCVNMLMDLDRARWLTYKSASAIDQGDLRPEQAAKTKAWCNQAYRRIVRLGHQVMGGIGYCEEHEMPMYFRHARMAEVMFGDTDTHLETVAEGLFGPDAGARPPDSRFDRP
ncbi:MAG: acyl-CoA/acyl-ACP dehydrogenase [Gammaproteobacteria bacterium]|nr:acyl-CoA/acyl-ACP dehydrogenase [Gammaproteobacteria bacterium]